MQEILNVIKELNPEVLFIVVVSASVNKYLKWTKYKFLVPLAISMIVTLAIGYDTPVKDIFRQWFVYSGQSMIIYELYKNFMAGRKRKQNVE